MKNKILKDEQLEQVAGGTSDQVGKDIDFMHTLKLMRPGERKLETLEKVFAQQGVTVVLHNDKTHSNEYYVNGERIPRMKTLMFIMNKLDKDFDIKRYL